MDYDISEVVVKNSVYNDEYMFISKFLEIEVDINREDENK